MSYGIGVIAGALIVEPIIKGLANWEAQWCAYRNTGEYNLDSDKNTDDWAEQRDPATGKWGLIRITKYKAPWIPGGGRVVFYTKDENGEHRNEWRLTKWWENRESRRQVSESQSASIEDNDNKWPTEEEATPVSPHKTPCVTDSERAGSPPAKRAEFTGVIKAVTAFASSAATKDQAAKIEKEVADLKQSADNRKATVTKFVMDRVLKDEEFVLRLAAAVVKVTVAQVKTEAKQKKTEK